MPGIQCVICLTSDTSSEEWCTLRECGHVFHTHCAAQALEHSRRCPQCRCDYSKRKYGPSNPPYRRIFFEFSDEPGSQAAPPLGGGSSGGGDGCGAGSGGGSAADHAQLAFLQGQLRDKDRRIQALSTQLAEAEEREARAAADLQLARDALRDKEGRLQEKLGELALERRQVKGLANQIANLKAELRQEAAKSSYLALSSDHSLAGAALSAEVDKLVGLGLQQPNAFWERLMSERSNVIMASANKWGRERAALERRQAELRAEADGLKAQVAGLQRSLAAQRQQQPGGGAPPTAQHPQQQQPARPLAGRHVRRFGNGSSAAAAAAAVDEEDPLLQPYDILGSLRQGDLPQGRPQQQPQQAEQQTAAAAAEGAAEDDDDEEIVLVDDSEEEAYSEVESDGEQQQTQRPQQTAAPPPQQQQQQQQQAPGGASQLLGKRPAAAAADENLPAAAVLPLAAGPGRDVLARGPGTSFIRNASAANLGIERGRYISSGPDGRGGVATAYQSGGGAGGGVRLSQKQLDVSALQPKASKKPRVGGGGSSAGGVDAAAAQALRRNNAMPITAFFGRAPRAGEQ